MDRGRRGMPIEARFVGRMVPTGIHRNYQSEELHKIDQERARDSRRSRQMEPGSEQRHHSARPPLGELLRGFAVASLA